MASKLSEIGRPCISPRLLGSLSTGSIKPFNREELINDELCLSIRNIDESSETFDIDEGLDIDDIMRRDKDLGYLGRFNT